MGQIITKKEINELAKFEGEIRGGGIFSYFDFIVKEEGEEGLIKAQKAMKNIDYPIEKKEIKRMDFYPISFWTTLLAYIQRLFNYYGSPLNLCH